MALTHTLKHIDLLWELFGERNVTLALLAHTEGLFVAYLHQQTLAGISGMSSRTGQVRSTSAGHGQQTPRTDPAPLNSPTPFPKGPPPRSKKLEV